jgi:hypothetical protein
MGERENEKSSPIKKSFISWSPKIICFEKYQYLKGKTRP